jgi:hypothetical protein
MLAIEAVAGMPWTSELDEGETGVYRILEAEGCGLLIDIAWVNGSDSSYRGPLRPRGESATLNIDERYTGTARLGVEGAGALGLEMVASGQCDWLTLCIQLVGTAVSALRGGLDGSST